MKVLTIDIETAPLTGYAWKVWQADIIKVIQPSRMMCFAAKWLGEKEVKFYSEHEDRSTMLWAVFALLDEADVVVHFNGQKFDIPHLLRELALDGYPKPSPFKQVDLLLKCRSQFRFDQNRLKDLTAAFGLAGKSQHEGFGLWEKCMAGDEKAWKTMRKYNMQDVRATEGLYLHLRDSGWLPGHPNRNLYGGTGCPTCGGKDLQKRGYAYTQVSKFQQYQCTGCLHYFRDTKRDLGLNLTGVAQ